MFEGFDVTFKHVYFHVFWLFFFQQVANELRRYYNILNGVVEYLKKEIKTWQEQFQLYYAKLGHQPDLDRIATQ